MKITLKLLCLLISLQSFGQVKTIVVDSKQTAQTYEGFGGLSAGASSRLLIDYDEPVRSQILDLLFKPNFGLSINHLKIEIGGDINSTDGVEPSHMHTRHDENYHRGYEWWLMKEAKKRNPEIVLGILEWGAPAWIGGGAFYSQDNIDYIIKFIHGAKEEHGLDIDYVGIWNETPHNVEWIKLLKKTIVANGLETQLVAAEGGKSDTDILEEMKNDRELYDAVDVIGAHYLSSRGKFTDNAYFKASEELGKPVWSNEDGFWLLDKPEDEWRAAQKMAKMLNRLFIEGRVVKTIIWSLICAYYDNLPIPRSGPITANSPWSGYYEVHPASWAIAHTTQFAKPGWKYLQNPGSGYIQKASYTSLVSPDGSDCSIIVETVDQKKPLLVTFQLQGSFSEKPVNIWRTTIENQFELIETVQPEEGEVTIELEPDAVYTLSTAMGQQKGSYDIPEKQNFPLPYEDNFENYKIGGMPKYLSDQGGVFEIVPKENSKDKCLRQVVPQKGIRWLHHVNPEPETILGDTIWTDYSVSVDALIENEGSVKIFGRLNKRPQHMAHPYAYWLRINHAGAWYLEMANTAGMGNIARPLASGQIDFSANSWHNLELRFKGDTIWALVDGKVLSEVTNSIFKSGMIGIGSGWNGAKFDNLKIKPL